MTNTETIAANSNTKATTPRHIWMAQVFALAQVSMDDAEAHCTRSRLNRWFNAGEPVWMAAESLRLMVTNGQREERVEREMNYLNGKMKVSDGRHG